MSDEDLRELAEGRRAPTADTLIPSKGARASDLWAGVSPSICDCMDAALSAPTHTEDEGVGR